MEYAVILFMLKKRRKPFRTIDQGLKHLFPSKTSNGEASQPLRSPAHRDNSVPQPPDVGLSFRKQALVENIDAWAMWISPPIFVVWNVCYWLTYRPWTNKLLSDNTLLDYIVQKRH